MRNLHPMRHLVDRAASRGLVDRLLGRLPPERATGLRLRLRRLGRPARLGTLRSAEPLSRDFGYDRGTPVDRYYIEQFLESRRTAVRGRVLEVKDSTYTDWLGDGVTAKDVLDIDPKNPLATIVADLADAATIPDASFDCFILTQTLQLIYEVHAAVTHAHRILKPGGALLATVPSVSPVVDDEQLTDYWRFTPASCARLFRNVFRNGAVEVRTYGNVLTSIAFLTGMAHEELSPKELEAHDPRYTMLIGVSAVKGKARSVPGRP
jgi:SAM-dependent methyltransferase